jgi:hypothetical protein
MQRHRHIFQFLLVSIWNIKEGITENGKHHIMRSFVIWILHQTFLVIKSRRMRCAGHVVCMEERRNGI